MEFGLSMTKQNKNRDGSSMFFPLGSTGAISWDVFF